METTDFDATKAAYSTDSARWAALEARDPASAGSFIYAVKTMGVYCRPTCPGRLAKRENVEYFDDVESAAENGYRACKRCRPVVPSRGNSKAES